MTDNTEIPNFNKQNFEDAHYDVMSGLINKLALHIQERNAAKGFWDGERNVGECIALMHSELSEALEGHRKNKQDDHLPHHSSITVELADTVIRILDFAGGFNLPIGDAIFEKLKYNAARPHKHGKNY